MTAAASGDGLDVLALNCGSSSLKFGLFRALATEVQPLVTGQVDAIGQLASAVSATRRSDGQALSDTAAIATHTDAVDRIAQRLADWSAPTPAAIGHRIVHGGPTLRGHCLIDGPVMRALEAATAFAPLHTPAALEVIRAAQARFPGAPQVACFDTAFHAHMPDVARVLPIPRALGIEGVQRYGFHGLSCESITQQLAAALPRRMIIAHLGGGASLTAVESGRSIDTSMGLTPTGGVMMETRSGDLDPGVLLYLLREKRLDAAQLEDLVDRRSGLLGVSDVSGDLRDLHRAASTNPAARLAIAMFAYDVHKAIAAMAAALQGLDLIVFTGGVGENDAEARAAICQGLGWLGVDLDAARNRGAVNPISRAGSRCGVQVLPCREDEQIARHVRAIIGQRSGEPVGSP